MENKNLFKGFARVEQYKETARDKAMREADMILRHVGSKYHLYMNRPLNIKSSRSIEVRGNMICATKRGYDILEEQYNIMSDL